MPVSSRKLVYDFRRKFNAIYGDANNNIELIDIIAYLNEAQEIWFENRISVAQTNQKVRNDLRPYKVDRESLTLKKKDGDFLATYPKSLYVKLNQSARVKKEDCCPGVIKEIPIRILQSDDVQDARINPFRKSDFFFEQLFAVENKEGLRVYTNGEMEIDSLFIDYYEKPEEIHAPSLAECEGEFYYDYNGRIITKDQDFQSDNTFAANDVVDIAIVLASRDVGDREGFESQINRILSLKNLHKAD